MEKEKKHTVGNVAAGFMIALALIVDAIQFFLTLTLLLMPLAIFLSILSTIIFFLWFLLLGAYSGTGAWKRMCTSGMAAVIELVPFIGGLPAVTGGVVGIIVQTRIRDARRALGKKVTPRTVEATARLQRMKAAQAKRADAAREDREAVQQERHAPANGNYPEEE